MLGGKSPVIVFNFASISTQSLLSKVGINIGDNSIFNFDIPLYSIPVYFDEITTGVVVDDHEKSLVIEVERDDNNNYERVVGSDVKLTVMARKDNVVFKAFNALLEQVLKYVPYSAYKIYLYHDDIFMIDASLRESSVTVRENTDTKVVSFTLTTRPEPKSQASQVISNSGKDLYVFDVEGV